MNTGRAALAAALAMLVIGCSGEKSAWNTAASANTIEALSEYSKRYPDSPHAKEAESKLQALRWARAQTVGTIEAYQEYLDQNKDGPHTDLARARVEEFEWAIAKASSNEPLLRSFISKYPKSSNLEAARDRVWQLGRPQVAVAKVDSLTIIDDGNQRVMGSVMTSYFTKSVNDRLVTTATSIAAGPGRIVIWRTFARDEMPDVGKHDLRTGVAFLKTDKGEYKFVRMVDLGKSDLELASEFGFKASGK